MFVSGGGIDLKTAAEYAEKNSKKTATTTSATITLPSKIGGITSTMLAKPIKIEIPSSKVGINSPFVSKQIKIEAPSTSTSKPPVVMKTVGNLGSQIRFIPPKVNTANNRVPAGSGGASGEKSTTIPVASHSLIVVGANCILLSLFFF